MVPLEKPFRDQACLEHPLKALELKQTKAPNAWTAVGALSDIRVRAFLKVLAQIST